MLTSFALIELNSLGKDEGIEDITAINNAMLAYKKAAPEQLESALKDIIMACDNYLTKIPRESREKQARSSWSEVLPDSPHAEIILELQKKAVFLTFLPNRKHNLQARLDVIRTIYHISEESAANTEKRKPRKVLGQEYWSEMIFHSDMNISQWLQDPNDESLTSIVELLDESEPDEAIYYDDLKPFEVSFTGGMAYQNNTQLHTLDCPGYGSLEPHVSVFVALENEKIFASQPTQDLQGVYHSSFSNGKPVMCAGTLTVENGQITQITVFSGHYKPNSAQLLSFLELLQKNGVDLSKATVIDSPNGLPKNAATYLKTRGRCLPADLSDFLYQEAMYQQREIEKKGYTPSIEDSLEVGPYTRVEELLDEAAELGHPKALMDKADYLMSNPAFYKHMSIDEKNRMAKEIYFEILSQKKLEKYHDLCLQQLSYLGVYEPPQDKINEEGSQFILLSKRVNEKRTIRDLYTFYKELKSEASDSKEWTQIFNQIQKKAFHLCKNSKTGLSKTEISLLDEIWDGSDASAEKERLGFFKPEASFKTQFNELRDKGEIKLVEEVISASKKTEF